VCCCVQIQQLYDVCTEWRCEYVKCVVVSRYSSCMMRCWDASQDSRPDFTRLVALLGDFLEADVRQVTAAVSVLLLPHPDSRLCEQLFFSTELHGTL